MRRALNDAVKWGLIPMSPISNKVDAPNAAHHEHVTFTADQMQCFFGALEPGFWYVYFYVLVLTGMRLSEMRGLRWTDVDLAAESISVRQNSYSMPGIGLVVKDVKSAAGRRPIDLDAEAVSLLRAHKSRQNETRLQLGDRWDNRDLVFATDQEKRLGEKPVYRVRDQACTRADVPVIKIHELRRTSATLLMKTGVPFKVVSERLGHSTSAITLNIYSHVSQSLQRGGRQAGANPRGATSGIPVAVPCFGAGSKPVASGGQDAKRPPEISEGLRFSGVYAPFLGTEEGIRTPMPSSGDGF